MFPRKRMRPVRLIASASLAATTALGLATSRAQTILPTQGVVTSGAASIRESGADLSITQTSPRAIVNWGRFSIGQSDAVTFNQPSASSAILNRVTGTATSTIAGQLQGSGQVYLVNPNGIAITRTGNVRVGGGFVASTLGIADSDFNSGNLRFTGNGASAGVANAGSIEAGSGGFVGLLGGTVSNSGVVTVPLGKVAMGSGEQATLNLTGDDFLQVAVPTNTKTADGQALIDVSGKVRAAGGSVQLKAATVANAIRNAVNVPGELSVSSARVIGGSIVLSGGAGGDVSVAGRLRAAGRTKGGAIAIDGHDVALRRAKLVASSAKGLGGSVTVTGTNAISLALTSVDASGATGGGAIRIGGDFHGASDLTSAQTTTIDSASTLNASATASGAGGTVAVWSDGTTNFAGKITAVGGPNGGNGGYVEVSANPATRGVLDFTGSADLTAPKGTTGTLLLDPYDIVISTGTDSGGSFSGGIWTPTATSVINNVTLENQLATANVVISTGLSGSPGTDAGNLTVSAPITWASNNSLTLTANNVLSINAPITNTVGNFVILALATGPTGQMSIGSPISLGVNGEVNVSGPAVLVANVTATGGFILFNNAVTLGANVTVDSGGGTTEFNGTVDGGHVLTANGGNVSFFGDVGSTTPLAGLSVTGPVLLEGNVTTNNGTITFNGNVQVEGDIALNSGSATTTFGGTVDSCFSCEEDPSLAATAGAFSFGGPWGSISPLTAVSLTSTNSMTLPSITAASIVARATGGSSDLTLAAGTVLTASDAGTSVVLAAGRNFINNSNAGNGAIVFNTDGLPAQWQVYSANPANDIFGGLNSGQTAVWDTTFNGTVTPTSVDRYYFAFQPTITVTSTNDSKTYGQDVTGRVATDYVISGLQPPDPSGAYLGDSASAVYSGTPLVSSLGSPARAPVSDSPYPITVAQGTFTVSDNYALTLDSAGLLTVNPLALTYSVANTASTYGTTAMLGAATLTGVLPGDSVGATVGAFSGTTQVAVGPRTPVGVYSEEVTGLSSPNYTIAPSGNTPGTLTIDPLTVTYSVANASSIFGTTPILGPATLFGVLPGDLVDPTVGAFTGRVAVPLNPLTPVGQYAELVTAISNPNYRLASAPNFPGVLTIAGSPDPGFLPGLTQINNPAPSEAGTGGIDQVLPHFGVACNEPPSLPDPNRYSDPDAALRAISQAVENYFRRCQNPTQTTIADALDAYAAKLQVLAPRLPPALRNVPAIVAEGARRVRAARSRTEAVALLRQTVAAVHKEISLVLSEDPETRSRELRDGDIIAGALDGATATLVNSGGL